MNAIVIVDSKFGISCKGKPLVSIPAEKKSRMQEIAGKVCVYGVRYINELPGQQPVAGCVNVIFTDGVKTDVKTTENVILADSLEAVRKELSQYPQEDIYIIDNEKLYKEFLPDINTFHVTKVDYTYNADAFIDNLDENSDFVITADSDEQYCFDIVYNFIKYERRNNK